MESDFGGGGGLTYQKSREANKKEIWLWLCLTFQKMGEWGSKPPPLYILYKLKITYL